MKIIKFLSFLIFASNIFIACSKKVTTAPSPTPTPNPSQVVDTAYISEYKYNLNVVYFVPSDRQVNADYLKRISGILLNGQSFIKQWMNFWGYGDKTFGLLVNDPLKLVKIKLIWGSKPSTGYPYTGGGAIIKQEIEASYNADRKSVV